MRTLPLASACFLLSSLAVLGVACAAIAPRPPTIDPALMRALRTGIPGVRTLAPTPDRAPVVIRLAHPATPSTIASLLVSGAELETVAGKTLFYDRFVPAHLSERSARAVAAITEVERIDLAPVDRLLPLDHAAELIRLADARGSRPALDLLNGEGITVGDSDSLVDVFHPSMFRGDAGYYDWIDVDHDGAFSPGIDAVDLNRNGAADPGETVRAILAATYDYYGPIAARSAAFDPGTDWLYLDTNGNGARDYGAGAGFSDADPAFGEPLFAPDDLDRNGRLDVGEKVVRLGTSKYKKVRVKVSYLAKINTIFERGKNLSATPIDLTHGALYGFPDAFHATAVASIIAGDLPLAGRRRVGIAPAVDLLETFEVDATGNNLPTAGTTWALAENADVMLYELAPWTGLPLDGTDALSQLIDASSTKSGVIHTCPTGDQGSAHKHAHASIAVGGKVDLPFNMPSHAKGRRDALTYVDLTAHVRGGDVASMSVVAPDGTIIAITDGATGNLPTGAAYYATTSATTRGTMVYDLLLYVPRTSPSVTIPVGAWKLEALGGSTDVTLDAYLSDDKSSWAIGAAWDSSVSTDAMTIGIPSVADHCIAVGSMPDHVADPRMPWFDLTFYAEYDVPAGLVETQGAVRAYSPRGPRIDGVQKPDILAPDNPWAAVPHSPTDSIKFPYGAVMVFGGTSGASPHVTGVGALLAQAGLRGDAARDAIRKGARKGDAAATLPNGDYGYGLLDAAGALGVAASGSTPTIVLAIDHSPAPVGSSVAITPTLGTGADLQVKWDDDYDGTWDTPYASSAPHTVTMDHAGSRSFKARVRNSSGHFAEALAIVVFVPPSAEPASDAGSSGDQATTSPGCGCRTAGERPTSSPAWGLLAIVGVVRNRRSRRGRSAIDPRRGEGSTKAIVDVDDGDA